MFYIVEISKLQFYKFCQKCVASNHKKKTWFPPLLSISSASLSEQWSLFCFFVAMDLM